MPFETFLSGVLDGQVLGARWASGVTRMACEQTKWHAVLVAVALIFLGLCVRALLAIRNQRRRPAALVFLDFAFIQSCANFTMERSVKMNSFCMTCRQLLVSHGSFFLFSSAHCVALLSGMRKAADGFWLSACFQFHASTPPFSSRRPMLVSKHPSSVLVVISLIISDCKEITLH